MADVESDDRVGLWQGIVGDGRGALALTGIALLFSGAFAIFLSLRREFLPHDVAFLGISAESLCVVADCRVVRFMFHDRVAWGGTLIAVGILYLWMEAFPLRQNLRWAWRAFAVSGAAGFSSFLAYLGYGYLDSWHGIATLALLPVFIFGIWRTFRVTTVSAQGWLMTQAGRRAPFLQRVGRIGLIATGIGMILAGAVILYLGSTDVFVVEDLGFMGVTRASLDAVNVRLVPLIAHDRAGFGGGLLTVGILVVFAAWYSEPRRSFYQAISAAGLIGFATAIGIHYFEGYVNTTHLMPAFAGASLFIVSLIAEMAGRRR